MRVDLENNIKQQLVSEFVGEDIKLENKNEASNKWYKELYEEFLVSGKLSSMWIDKCNNSDYMNKFYSQGELDKFNQKYSKFKNYRCN